MDASTVGKILINQIEHDFRVAIIKKDKKGYNLDPGQLISLKIGNAIQDQWLYVEAIYVDRGLGTISNYVADASTLLNIKIKNESLRAPADIELNFVIDLIAAIDSKSGEPTYKITGSHVLTNALQQQIRVFFENEEPTNMLKQIISEAKGEVELKIDANHVSDVKTSYISDIDMSLTSHIERLCDIISGEKLGAFFISIDLLSGYLKSFSTRIDRTSGKDNKIRIFNLSGANNAVSSDEFSNIFDWKEINGEFPAEMARDLFSPKTFNRFDHTKRKWITTEYTLKKLNTIFTNKEMDYKFIYNPPDWEERLGIVKDEYYATDDSLLGYKIRVATTRSSMLYGKVRCDLGIDVGSFTIIKGNSEALDKKYGGLWVISGVRHVIERQVAVTEMTLTRAFVIDDSGMGKTSKTAGNK